MPEQREVQEHETGDIGADHQGLQHPPETETGPGFPQTSVVDDGIAHGLDCKVSLHQGRARMDLSPQESALIIKPRIWGFICTTSHPVGCAANVREQVEAVRAAGVSGAGPRRVLIIGASTGYGLAARITAAFGYGAATFGVFYEKPGKDAKPGTAGWYNS